MSKSTGNRQVVVPTLATYWDRSQWPLQALWFLLPMLLVYELGAWVYAPSDVDRLPLILAERFVGKFFEIFGVTGYYLPGFVVVILLVSWHLVRRDPWRPEPRLYLVMLVEAMLWSIPLFVMSLMMFRPDAIQEAINLKLQYAGDLPMLAGLEDDRWTVNAIFSIGAGIYEELVFRLIAIALLHAVFVDLLRLPDQWGALAAVFVSAVAFALYHFASLNITEWTGRQWRHFVFYLLAGFYFAAVYLWRGFGIVVGTHAIYDLLVVTLQAMQPDG